MKVSKETFSRRDFIACAGSTALSLSLVRSGAVRGSAANSRIRLGVIGCGGRGSWITEHFVEHGGYEIAAAADYFPDRLDDFCEKYDIPANRRYSGLSGYARLIEDGVDAVAIESPPYFHPQQAAEAVKAGCHVYLAKPVAVDVPGCRLISASAAEAAARERCFFVDFQTRADPFFIEALRRVHQGAIGDFAFGESSYHAGNPFVKYMPILAADPSNAENRLRAWGLDRALSGDIITEQNIHTLDVASWIMNREPVYAMGTGGHKVRTDVGTCWDHFALIFQYPGNVGITFSSRQFEGHDTVPDGIRNRMFGSKGVLETEYGGQVMIRGENFYRGGSSPSIYRDGAVANIAEFHRCVSEGDYGNTTVAPSVRSNLLTILGRTAAYRGEPVFWYQIVKSDERLEADLDGLREGS